MYILFSKKKKIFTGNNFLLKIIFYHLLSPNHCSRLGPDSGVLNKQQTNLLKLIK